MIYYKFFSEENLMFTVVYGEVSSEEFSNYINDIVTRDYKGLSIRGLTILCKNLNLKELNTADVFKNAKKMHAANFRENGKSAILATTDLTYAFARVYQTVVNLQNIDETKVYRESELNNALIWLDLQELTSEIKSELEQCSCSDLIP